MIREINWRRLTGRKEDKNFYYMEQERKWCQKMGLNLIRLHEVSFLDVFNCEKIFSGA